MTDRSEFVVSFRSEDQGLVGDFKQIGTAGKRAGDKIEDAFEDAGREVRKFGQTTDRTMNRVRRSTSSVTKAATSLRGAFLGLGVGLAAAAGGRAAFSLGTDLLSQASDAEEAQSKFDVVFRGVTEEATDAVQRIADETGRSRFALTDFFSTLQDTFVPLGFARDEALELSETLVQLGVDLGSFNNRADAEVIKALQSAIVGNTETLRQFGVVITQETLNQELLAQGIEGGVKAATEAEKAYARVAITLRSTTDAQGDAARTAESFENRVKRLQAAFEEVRVELGGQLIELVNELVTDLGGLDEIVDLVTIGLTAGAEAFEIILKAAFAAAEGFLQTGQDADTLTENISGLSDDFEGFFEIAEDVGEGVKRFTDTVADAGPIFSALGQTGAIVFNALQVGVDSLILGFTAFQGTILPIQEQLLGLARSGFEPLQAAFSFFVREGIEGFADILDGAARFVAFFDKDLSFAASGAAAVIRGSASNIAEGFTEDVDNLLTAAEATAKDAGERLGEIQRDAVERILGARPDGTGALGIDDLLGFGDTSLGPLTGEGNAEELANAIDKLWEAAVEIANPAEIPVEVLPPMPEEVKETVMQIEAEAPPVKVEVKVEGDTEETKKSVEETKDAIDEFSAVAQDSFEGLLVNLSDGERGFEDFANTAIRSLARVAAQQLTSSIFTGLGFSEGGTLSFSQGGTLTSGGKPISFGAFPTGGVVRDPTVALFGDQSPAFKGEAFVPIPGDAQGIPVDFRGGFPEQAAGGDSAPIYNFRFDVSATDAASFNDQLVRSSTRDLLTGIVADGIRGASPGLRAEVRSVANSA